VWLPEDDLRIETCWRDFKCFNVNNFMFNEEKCGSLKMILGSKHVGEILNVLI